MSSSRKSSSQESHRTASGGAPSPLGNADVRRIFYGLMLSMFLSALNQTIVATALPTIGRDFGDLENLSWVIIAYLLSSTVVSPLYGKLAIASLSALVAWPAMPLWGVVAVLTLIGFGAGTVYPVATVSIQNAVPATEVGTATGAMNFFRALASTLAVAIMGAILLAGLGATPERGTGVELLVETAGAAGVDVAAVFRFAFAAADIFV